MKDRLDIVVVGPFPHRVDGRETFKFGGSIFDERLVRGLAEVGHRVRAITTYLPWDGLSPGDLGPDVEVDWFAVGALLFVSGLPAAQAVAESRAEFEHALGRAVAGGRPDVVVLGNESQSMYAPDVCRRYGLPTLLVAHGVPTATLRTDAFSEEDRRTVLAGLARVDRIVSVAEHLAEILRESGLERVETIATGVDTEAFRPRGRDPRLLRSLGIDDGRPVVGSFSPLRPDKRVGDLVAAAELVLQAEPRAVFVVAGSGPTEDAVARAVADRGLRDAFRITGELELGAVPDYLSLCDVSVLASEAEGCPLVCIEAQAAGVPVVATDIAGCRELIEDGETGLVFAVGDVEGLGGTILRVVQDRELARSLAERGRAAALERGKPRWLEAFSRALRETADAGPLG